MRPAALLPAAVAAALAGAACSDGGADGGAPAGFGAELLRREPDAVHRQVGILERADAERWDALATYGWRPRPVESHGRAFAVAGDVEAGVELPALAPRDRELELVLWEPAEPPEEPRAVRVELNGVALGSAALGPEPATVALEAPGAAWREGRNVLALRVDALAPAGPAELAGEEIGVGLARVAYDARREPRLDTAAGAAELVAGTGLVFDLVSLGPADLRLRGRARGAGTLAIEVARVAPRSGAAEGPAPLDLAVPLADEPVDRRLPLPAAEGRPLRLRLTWRGGGEDDPRLALQTATVTDRAPVERPPVVLLVLDTLAARNLSIHGYGRETAANLAALAAEGVVFERAFANSTWTLPSHLSMFSGLHPHAHNFGEESARPDAWTVWQLAENRLTLAELFRGAGWATAGFVDVLWLNERVRFAQGFDRFDTSPADVRKEHADGGMRLVTELARRWLDGRDGDAPPFLFLHAYDAHGPYTPDERHAGTFADDGRYRGREAPTLGAMHVFGAIHAGITKLMFPPGKTPARLATARIRRAYDEGVATLDTRVGELFRMLRERGLYDDALIVVTSDHGETMDEGAFLFGHGEFAESVAHVPLIVKLPGGRRAGTRVATSVQLVDLFPTFVDLLGMDLATEHLHGRSLVPLIEGGELPPRPTLTAGDSMRTRAIELDGWRLEVRSPGRQASPATMLSWPGLDPAWIEEHVPELAGRPLTVERYEAIRARDDFDALVAALREELAGERKRLTYLPDDPDGEVNLADERPDKVRELEARLAELTARIEAAADDAVVPSTRVELDPADVERLRALGYAGPDD